VILVAGVYDWWRFVRDPRAAERREREAERRPLVDVGYALVVCGLLCWALAPDGLTDDEQGALALGAVGALGAAVLHTLALKPPERAGSRWRMTASTRAGRCWAAVARTPSLRGTQRAGPGADSTSIRRGTRSSREIGRARIVSRRAAHR
jgi:hypothetical protein